MRSYGQDSDLKGKRPLYVKPSLLIPPKKKATRGDADEAQVEYGYVLARTLPRHVSER